MSSFEAACAQMLGWSSSTSTKPSSPPTPTPKTDSHRSPDQPKLGGAAVGRLAPEFDGLNCFETLISEEPT